MRNYGLVRFSADLHLYKDHGKRPGQRNSGGFVGFGNTGNYPFAFDSFACIRVCNLRGAMMETIRWSVAQILSQKSLAIQKEVQRTGCGTYLPMMRYKRFIEGKETNTARPAMPGYLFVWGASGNFYGRDGLMIARVLGNISEEQYQRIKKDNADGKHDEWAPGPATALKTGRKVRRRRPRPGKRWRMARQREAGARL